MKFRVKAAYYSHLKRRARNDEELRELKRSRRFSVALCDKARQAIRKAHGGKPASPGLSVRVKGHADISRRNMIVLSMAKSDPLLNKANIVRMSAAARKRLGVKVGQRVDIEPLSNWETWYHGTSYVNPLEIIQKGFRVGPRAGFGSGVYMSDTKEYSQMYAGTGLFICQVAWGQHLQFPPPAGSPLRQAFVEWCGEHDFDANRYLRMTSWFDPNGEYKDLENIRGKRISRVCQWARLNGHYFPAESFPVLTPSGSVDMISRVYPGPMGEFYKPNRLRVMELHSPAGEVLWKRS